MRRLALFLAAGLALTASPATAQSWSGTYDAGYGRGQSSDWSAAPSRFDWRSQLDRPGDYRCDAFWDANRPDCGAGWRDQRRGVSIQARGDYRQLAGYGRDRYSYAGYGHNRYGYSGGYGGYGYSNRDRGHGYDQGGGAYYGAYGRPDLVYPAGERGYRSRASHGDRADWCRANYRSYDPRTGYYRAYSGRLIYCG